MEGESDLQILLQTLNPNLLPATYVFCTLQTGSYGALPHTRPLASVAEAEGLTLILPQDQADQNGLNYHGVFRCISLGVHSSLTAVGLTATIATELANHQISANMLAGFHHDHVLVPAEQAEMALIQLQNLSSPDGN